MNICTSGVTSIISSQSSGLSVTSGFSWFEEESGTDVPKGMEDTVLRFPLEMETDAGVILKGIVEDDEDELVSSLPSLSNPNTDTRSRKVSSSQSPALEPKNH